MNILDSMGGIDSDLAEKKIDACEAFQQLRYLVVDIMRREPKHMFNSNAKNAMSKIDAMCGRINYIEIYQELRGLVFGIAG